MSKTKLLLIGIGTWVVCALAAATIHRVAPAVLFVAIAVSVLVLRARLDRPMLTAGAVAAVMAGGATAMQIYLFMQEVRWRRQEEHERVVQVKNAAAQQTIVEQSRAAIAAGRWDEARELYYEAMPLGWTEAYADLGKEIRAHFGPLEELARAQKMSDERAKSGRALGVADDCYDDGYVCDRSRLSDAASLAASLAETMAQAGWAKCYEVQYVSGDEDHTAGAITVAVVGRRNAGFPACLLKENNDSRTVGDQELKTLAGNIKRKLLSQRVLIRGTDLLQVTDGWGGEVQLSLPGRR